MKKKKKPQQSMRRNARRHSTEMDKDEQRLRVALQGINMKVPVTLIFSI